MAKNNTGGSIGVKGRPRFRRLAGRILLGIFDSRIRKKSQAGGRGRGDSASSWVGKQGEAIARCAAMGCYSGWGETLEEKRGETSIRLHVSEKMENRAAVGGL